MLTAMGRPPSLWLQRAYEILADGEWHPREDVIREMMKAVPPALAYRRAIKLSYSPDTFPREHLISRGARHLCLSSLNGAGYLEVIVRGEVELMRATNVQVKKPLVPKLVDVVEEEYATHILVPVDDVSLLQLKHPVEFVRLR